MRKDEDECLKRVRKITDLSMCLSVYVYEYISSVVYDCLLIFCIPSVCNRDVVTVHCLVDNPMGHVYSVRRHVVAHRFT